AAPESARVANRPPVCLSSLPLPGAGFVENLYIRTSLGKEAAKKTAFGPIQGRTRLGRRYDVARRHVSEAPADQRRAPRRSPGHARNGIRDLAHLDLVA